MPEVNMGPLPIKVKVRAIVQFGPANPHSGYKAGEFYQVTIDPNMVSPLGAYIRFGFYPGDEINGWQRVEAMTVCEVLGESDAKPADLSGYAEVEGAEVTMRAIA